MAFRVLDWKERYAAEHLLHSETPCAECENCSLQQTQESVIAHMCRFPHFRWGLLELFVKLRGWYFEYSKISASKSPRALGYVYSTAIPDVVKLCFSLGLPCGLSTASADQVVRPSLPHTLRAEIKGFRCHRRASHGTSQYRQRSIECMRKFGLRRRVRD